MRGRRFSLLAALVLGAWSGPGPQPAAAQAWIRSPGDAYVGLSYRRISADKLYGVGGVPAPSDRFTQHTLNLYTEVGVVERWLMLSLEGELFRQNELHDAMEGYGLARTRGVGDFRLGAWTGLLTQPFRLSFGVTVGLPIGDASPDAGTDADLESRQHAAVLPNGDGEVDVGFRLLAGHSWQFGQVLRMYGVAELGYVVRTRGFLDQLGYRAELGFQIPQRIADRFWLMARLTGLESLGEVSAPIGGTGLGDGVSGTFWSVEASARIVDQFYLGLGIESAFRGVNLPAAPALKLSLAYEIRRPRDRS